MFSGAIAGNERAGTVAGFTLILLERQFRAELHQIQVRDRVSVTRVVEAAQEGVENLARAAPLTWVRVDDMDVSHAPILALADPRIRRAVPAGQYEH